MKIVRYKKNPILMPRGYEWESIEVFNPAVLYVDSRIHLFYRAVGDYQYYISCLGHAVFDEELNLIKRYNEPCFKPDVKLWEHSIEDARITEIEGEFYMTYVIALTPIPPDAVRIRYGIPKTQRAITRVGLAKIDKDFHNFNRLGIITPYDGDERDVVLFPERINGKYIALHRPKNWIGPDYGPVRPSIWFAEFKEQSWIMSGHKLVMEPKEDWESLKIGVGAPPLKTEKGWLLIYHGVDASRKYSAGAALLDLQEPWKVIARTQEPFMVPQEEYEINGDVPNVIFPEAAIVIRDELIIFYGGADKVCCAVKVNLNSFLETLLGNN